MFAFCLLLFGANRVNAAIINVNSNDSKIGANQEFTIVVAIDTQDQSINAMEGNVIFPSDLLEIKKIQDGNSIINFWIERTAANQSGVIHFSGIIPGGYQNENGFIFSIVFKAGKIGDGSIKINEANALLNDGTGKAADLRISPFHFSVLELDKDASSRPPPVDIEKDAVLPEEFNPEISSSADLFDGKWFLVFATQDKGSGIDYYQVREGVFGNFHTVLSPYLLQNQNLDKVIFVKAVDRSNNERIETVYPPNWRPWYKNYWIFVIIIIGVMFIIIIRKFLWKKYKK